MRITLFEKARIYPVGDEGAALALCYSPRLAYRLLSSLVAWTDSHPSPRSIDSFILAPTVYCIGCVVLPLQHIVTLIFQSYRDIGRMGEIDT